MDSRSWPQVSKYVDSNDVAEIASATGAMLVGRRTWEAGAKLKADEPGGSDYPFAGPMFLLSHRPLEPAHPGVTILSGDIEDAVATALDAAGDKNLEILGADVAGQCLEKGLVDEILVYLMPVLVGDGIPFSSRAHGHVGLELVDSKQSGSVTILRYQVQK